jgi:hypothetical protein
VSEYSGQEHGPGRPFDAWLELRFAIAELHSLASQLTVNLDIGDEHAAVTWNLEAWRAADLLERTLADVGTLSAQWLRCSILDRRGIDPLA